MPAVLEKEGRDAAHETVVELNPGSPRATPKTNQLGAIHAAHHLEDVHAARALSATPKTTEPEARNAAHDPLVPSNSGAQQATPTNQTGGHDAAHASLVEQGATAPVAFGGIAAPEALARRIRDINEALISAPVIEQESQHAALHDLNRTSDATADAGGRKRS
jgi:hypothetical protein